MAKANSSVGVKEFIPPTLMYKKKSTTSLFIVNKPIFFKLLSMIELFNSN